VLSVWLTNAAVGVPRTAATSGRSGHLGSTVAYAHERDVGVDAMTDEFSISVCFVALRTADLDRSREFYENLLGLNVCGEKPGEFLQFAVGDAALCFDLFDGEEPPAAIFAVRGLEPRGASTRYPTRQMAEIQLQSRGQDTPSHRHSRRQKLNATAFKKLVRAAVAANSAARGPRPEKK
jgi:catechol 2,3-dioxygenase-like lactoylglutathione lyase family enzyme